MQENEIIRDNCKKPENQNERSKKAAKRVVRVTTHSGWQRVAQGCSVVAMLFKFIEAIFRILDTIKPLW